MLIYLNIPAKENSKLFFLFNYKDFFQVISFFSISVFKNEKVKEKKIYMERQSMKYQKQSFWKGHALGEKKIFYQSAVIICGIINNFRKLYPGISVFYHSVSFLVYP